MYDVNKLLDGNVTVPAIVKLLNDKFVPVVIVLCFPDTFVVSVFSCV